VTPPPSDTYFPRSDTYFPRSDTSVSPIRHFSLADPTLGFAGCGEAPCTTDTLTHMPEGDTVWRTARRLHDVLANQILVTSDFRVPAYSTVDLTGSRVREVVARGKHLLLRTEPGLTVHTHLKMDGSWQLYRVGSPWRGPGFEVRLVLASTDWVCVGFRLGIVEVLRTAAEASVVGHLGPDLLGPD
jgi:endonuclease-8